MKLSKRALLHRSNVRTRHLVGMDLLERKSDVRKWHGPKWDDQLSELEISAVSGPDPKTEYNYTITFSKNEIVYFIKLAVEKLASSRYDRALGAGAIAILEELLKLEE